MWCFLRLTESVFIAYTVLFLNYCPSFALLPTMQWQYFMLLKDSGNHKYNNGIPVNIEMAFSGKVGFVSTMGENCLFGSV